MYKGYITDVEGIKVGHASYDDAMTGCTAIICEEGATGGVDVRGSGPGTRETDIFDPKKFLDTIHGIVLTGGSAFGLEAASGTMNYLEEEGIGLDFGFTHLPIIPSAVIYDLEIGDPMVRPDRELGYLAAKNASREENRQGNIGCGLGATVGKLKDKDSVMKGGLGSATIKLGDLIVSAMVAVNAVGDIYDYKSNRQIAGPYDKANGKLLNTYDMIKNGEITRKNLGKFENKNTTIGVVATNAKLNKAQANKLAEMCHNGMARSINPIHTLMDGDTIFTLGTNQVEEDISILGTMGAEVVSRAIANAIYKAESYKNILAHRDI